MPTIVDKLGNIDYFGRLSWGNFFDWLVTLCLGGIIVLTTASLGGARPDTQLVLLPLFVILIILHGLWLAVDSESPKRISHVPVFFAPFLFWMVLSILWVSPVAWRGWYECILAFKIFVYVWVLTNNVRTRAHQWLLLVMALSPAAYAIFIGFYQFFQNPSKLANPLTDYGVQLSPQFLGRATGSFADPNSFAAFLLMLLPALLIAGLVPRLPIILRVLCIYIGLIFLAAIFFAQMFWPLVFILPISVMVPWLCFQQVPRRLKYTTITGLVMLLLLLPLAFFYPPFKQNAKVAISEEGEGVRLVLWEEAIRMTLDNPIFGAGAGSFSMKFEQSQRLSLAALPMTPHNDYLLVLSEYGVMGGALLFLPFGYILVSSYRSWREEPYRLKLKDNQGTIMPPRKFFLSLGLSGALSFGLCLFCTFVFFVPSLALYGALFLCILIKSSFTRKIRIPEQWFFRWSYLGFGIVLSGVFYAICAPRLESQALELRARQRLDQIVEQRVHVSGNEVLLEEVVSQYQEATELNPKNVDAWIGLSAAYCQQFFRHPSNFESIGKTATESAQNAINLSESYWLGWAQLGVSQSLRGNLVEAEQALSKALELAPNNSNAHYYWAAYMSYFPDKQSEAISAVHRALAINPGNAAARRLQRKLLIL
jgi:tetratricopeptide (TPR) repeat protein